MANRSANVMPRARDVLVVKTSSFGDVIHTLPAVHALKSAYPGVRFHWAVNSEWAPLLEENPDLHSLCRFPRKDLRGPRAANGFLRWCRETRLQAVDGFDCAVDFQGLLRSLLIAKFCRCGTIAGLSDAREGSRHFYTLRADVGGILHAVDRYLALAALLGADISRPVFPLTGGQPINGLEPGLLSSAIALHPFARGQGKSLDTARIEEITRSLAPRKVVLLGMGGETGHTWPENAINLLHQTTLPQLIWVLRQCEAVVSVDSGPMHLAAALNRPLLGLHSWSDPRKVGPWSRAAHVWKAGRMVQVSALPEQPEAWCQQNAGWDSSLPEAIRRWVDGTVA